MKSVAIFGSCVSRDNFNSLFNKNYKDFFDVVLFQNQSSILSIMSEKKEKNTSDFKSGFEKWTYETECNKSFFYHLEKTQPDYLIIDLFADVYFGSIELTEGNYFTNNTKYFRFEEFKKFKRFKPYNDYEDYLTVWKEKIHCFFEKIKVTSGTTKVFIVNTIFRDTFKNGESLNEIRKNSNIMTTNLDVLNSIYQEMLNYMTTNFVVSEIDMTVMEYKLNENHPWGKLYVHYEMDYYLDFFNKLQKVVIQELEAEILHLKK